MINLDSFSSGLIHPSTMVPGSIKINDSYVSGMVQGATWTHGAALLDMSIRSSLIIWYWPMYRIKRNQKYCLQVCHNNFFYLIRFCHSQVIPMSSWVFGTAFHRPPLHQASWELYNNAKRMAQSLRLSKNEDHSEHFIQYCSIIMQRPSGADLHATCLVLLAEALLK